jgi:multidrug transporter EmrE-like cation transporter
MTAADRPENAVVTVTWTAWLWLLVAIALNNVGNFLLRAVSEAAGISPALFLSGRFALAVVSFGLGFFFYVKVLSRLSLSVAYPVMVGTTMIVVAVASYWQIDTPLTVGQIAGTVLVLIGVTLVSAEAKG